MVISLVRTNLPDVSLQEISRVAFARRNSKNPRRSYEAQFEIEMKKAQRAVDILNNELMGDPDAPS